MVGTGEAEVALIEVDSVAVIEEASGEGEEVTVEDTGLAKWIQGDVYYYYYYACYYIYIIYKDIPYIYCAVITICENTVYLNVHFVFQG